MCASHVHGHRVIDKYLDIVIVIKVQTMILIYITWIFFLLMSSATCFPIYGESVPEEDLKVHTKDIIEM